MQISSPLCYASLVQVGLIVAEVGLLKATIICSRRVLANATTHFRRRFYRTITDWKTRSATIFQDGGPERWAPSRARWLYRYALERGCFDIMLAEWIATRLLTILVVRSIGGTLDRLASETRRIKNRGRFTIASERRVRCAQSAFWARDRFGDDGAACVSDARSRSGGRRVVFTAAVFGCALAADFYVPGLLANDDSILPSW